MFVIIAVLPSFAAGRSLPPQKSLLDQSQRLHTLLQSLPACCSIVPRLLEGIRGGGALYGVPHRSTLLPDLPHLVFLAPAGFVITSLLLWICSLVENGLFGKYGEYLPQHMFSCQLHAPPS